MSAQTLLTANVSTLDLHSTSDGLAAHSMRSGYTYVTSQFSYLFEFLPVALAVLELAE